MSNREKIMETVNRISENNDEGLFGFIVREVDDLSYEDTGFEIVDLFRNYPQYAELLNKMLIAICGCSLIGDLPKEMEEYRDYYEDL